MCTHEELGINLIQVLETALEGGYAEEACTHEVQEESLLKLSSSHSGSDATEWKLASKVLPQHAGARSGLSPVPVFCHSLSFRT